MLRLLFPRLTAQPERGAELFARITREAREPHWYVAGQVPDSVDGRFAMVATITALLLVRLEAEAGSELAAALTERFVEAMEAEHREMGMGDPRLGRTVRKLVGALGRRVDLWRKVTDGADWSSAVRDSVYRGAEPTAGALTHTAATLRKLWRRLQGAPLENLAEGSIG